MAAGSETYALLDSGQGRKLEQVGPYLLERQAANAWWRPSLPAADWDRVVARHVRDASGGGHWNHLSRLPPHWSVNLDGLCFVVRATPFGHLGLFPEHTVHWPWMSERLRPGARVLNLFAYTGGASLACARAGAEVAHVDAAKKVVGWAGDNARANELSGIRFIAEDARVFVSREVRRGNRYDAVLLDPPTFGRGPDGRAWKIEDDLQPLLDELNGLLSDDALFVLVTCHTPGFSPLVLDNLLHQSFPGGRSEDSGEMAIPHQGSARPLPLGSFARRVF